MSNFDSAWAILAIAAAASLFWRALGAILSDRIEVDTPLFDWCVCVTQAIVGGLMARALLLPSNALVQTELIDRIVAAAVGLTVYFICRWKVLPGVLAGTAVMAALILWRGG